MTKIYLIFAAAILGMSYPTHAMDADTFYTKGVALKKKGGAALFSSDLKLLQNEMKAASVSVKAENAKAKAAGKPLYCPPANAKMGSEQALDEFGKIPQSRRKALTTKQAWREILIRKFPC
ncbi:MAG: hypothetical protein ACRCY3_05715 [Sphingorhabdus sp.]